MPEDYVQMMQKCWDVDPLKRPTMKELWDFVDKKLKETINNNNSGGGSNSGSLQQVYKTHSLAYHMSRILDDEIAKSKSFKSNYSLLNDLDVNLNENFINI